jgi:predicted transcriptional regulator
VALIVVLTGLFFWDILIVLIGLFIYYATMREFREYEILRVLEGKSIKTFMVKPDLLFKSDTSVMDCFSKMKDLRIPDAVVELNDGYGVISVEDISKLSKDLWPGTQVVKIARVVDAINVRENLAFVAQYMVAKDLEIMPVVEGKEKGIIGVIKRTDFADYIKIHRVL